MKNEDKNQDVGWIGYLYSTLKSIEKALVKFLLPMLLAGFIVFLCFSLIFSAQEQDEERIHRQNLITQSQNILQDKVENTDSATQFLMDTTLLIDRSIRVTKINVDSMKREFDKLMAPPNITLGQAANLVSKEKGGLVAYWPYVVLLGAILAVIVLYIRYRDSTKVHIQDDTAALNSLLAEKDQEIAKLTTPRRIKRFMNRLRVQYYLYHQLDVLTNEKKDLAILFQVAYLIEIDEILVDKNSKADFLQHHLIAEFVNTNKNLIHVMFSFYSDIE